MTAAKSLVELTDFVRSFAAARDWEQFHDPKNLTMALASEVGELSAILRWLRNDEVVAALHDPATHEAIVREVGDVGILLLLLCDRTGIRLDDAIVHKLALNSVTYPAELSRGRSERPDDPVAGT